MKKQKIKVSAYLLFLFNITSYCSLLHYDHAHTAFLQHQNQDTFESHKQLIKEYYLSDAYENDVKRACKNAQLYFDSIVIDPHSLVIFDVDDTAVVHYHRIDRFEYIWGHQQHLVENIEIGNPTVIKPVLALYNYLISKGCKIIFMSGRNEGIRMQTAQELYNAGYRTYEKLILFPTLYPPNGTLADWKAQKRKELSERYNLIASIGDREYDFYGGYTGYIIKLPNYLY